MNKKTIELTKEQAALAYRALFVFCEDAEEFANSLEKSINEEKNNQYLELLTRQLEIRRVEIVKIKTLMSIFGDSL